MQSTSQIKEIVFESIDSTQTYARENWKPLIEANPDSWVAIRAKEQLAGRGQGTCQWYSPPGKNVYVTFIFKWPVTQVNQLQYFPQTTALSVFETVKPYCDNSHKAYDLRIKWINDILLNGKKISGVLCESEIDEQEIICFIGVGVNINLVSELTGMYAMGSLETELGIEVNTDLFFQNFSISLQENIKKLSTSGLQHQKIVSNLFKLGEIVEVTDNDLKEVQAKGKLEGLNEYGHIILRLENGLVVTMTKGKLKW